MRASMSATGSVTVAILHSRPRIDLPRRLGDAGDKTAVSQLAEADAAQAVLAQVAARPPADATAVARTRLEFRLAFLPFYDCSRRHTLARRLRGRALLAQRHAHLCEERQRFFIIARGGDDDDVHAAHVGHLIDVDLREHELLAQTEGVIAATVQRAARHAAKIADARQHDVDQLIEE